MTETATTQTLQPLLTPTVPAGEETRAVAVLNHIQEAIGFVPDGIRLYGISPPLLESFAASVGYFMQHAKLRQELMAMIRYLVSSDAGCEFCIDLNEGFLINMGLQQDSIRAARRNPDQAPLPENEKSLMHLALNAVKNSKAVVQTDLEAVRQQGCSDRDIFDAVVLAANTRAFNLVLDTFKVEHQGVLA